MNELVCIDCPRGCVLRIFREGEEIRVEGNFCPKGKKFALAELTHPVRTICSTVRTVYPEVPVLPVRVSDGIPRDRIMDVMGEIRRTVITGPVDTGEPVIRNVLGLGVDVIATSGILKELRQD